MKSIITPKLFAIDTSVLGKVAKDYYSSIQSRRKKASEFLSTISARGLIPFFCLHHIEEILQHDNDTVVSGRLSLIKKFSQVAWVKPSSPEGLVGSIIDIQGTEITLLINDPNISIEKLVSKIRRGLIIYSTGESFINDMKEALLILRGHIFFEKRKQKRKAISSISHVRDSKTDNIKLTVLHESRLKSPNEVEESINLLKRNLTQQLKERGDKKLENYDEYTDQFTEQVVTNGLKMHESNSDSLYKKFLNSHGVEEREVDANWTIGDLGYYATFKEKLKVITRSFNFDFKKAMQISNSIPSWFIWTELDKKIREEKFASGSNVIDKYLAALSLYSDILIVDKRVKEYFRQIAQKNKKFSAINNHVVKLSNYENLEKKLNAMNIKP